MRKRHLRFGILALLVSVSAAGSGCSTMNNTEKGAIGGAVVGTGLGTALGAATGHTGAGAVIGGLAGTAGGALVGNDIDKTERRNKDIAQAAALADAQAQSQRLGMADVIGLAQAGHSDGVIINQIRKTRSTFSLTTSDLDMLKNAGVSQGVIAEMQAARAGPSPARVVVRETTPVIYEAPPAVVVRPAPVVVVGPPRHYHCGPYYGGGIYYGRRW